MFLFFSLALIKRYSELVTLESTAGAEVHARGYLGVDKVFLVAQGIASGYLAVLVLALYTNSEIIQRLYARHNFFWAICLILLYWVSYLWMMAERGRIHEDPVVFALTDPRQPLDHRRRGTDRPARDMKPAAFAIATLAALGAAALLAAEISSDTPALQWKQYEADVPKTIIELQPFRRAASVEFPMSGDWGTATLVNLNPQINAWFLLTLWSPGTPAAIAYHLENPLPKTQTLALSEAHPYGITLSADGHDAPCELWPAGQPAALQQAQRSELPYAPLCEDRLYLRNHVSGTYTHLERVTGFLRDHVWGGEKIVGFVKQEFFRDAFLEKGAADAQAPAAGHSRCGAQCAAAGAHQRGVRGDVRAARASRNRHRPGSGRRAARQMVSGAGHGGNLRERHAAASDRCPRPARRVHRFG